jgi:uncharacterized OB-fold protein
MDIVVTRDAATAAFFDATARSEFLLVRDRETGQVLDPLTDPQLEPGRYETFPASGAGTVVSWAVVHERDSGGAATRTVVAVVELAEGPWWWTQLVDAEPYLEAGTDLTAAAVEVVFTKSGPGEEAEYVPRFRLTPSGL